MLKYFLPLILLVLTGTGSINAQVQIVTSKDGTTIASDKVGQGPALVVIGGALGVRGNAAELAQLLAPNFTVYSLDRRGRGESGDTKPYSVEREIEDIEATIDAAGGSAYVYGISSGACLALETAAQLGDKITKLAIYEPPYDEAEGATEKWKVFDAKLNHLLEAKRHSEAVESFMKFVGAKDQEIAGMKASPAWKGMEAVAPTLAYDMDVVGDDRSIPAERVAKITAPTLVMDGGASAKSMPFMRVTADKLGKLIPNAERQTIEGQGHGVSPKAIAPVLIEFFEK